MRLSASRIRSINRAIARVATLIKQRLERCRRSWVDRDASGEVEPFQKANAVFMSLSWTRRLTASVSRRRIG